MTSRFTPDFLLVDWNEIEGKKKEGRTSGEIYSKLIDWSYKAKKQNEKVFDRLSQWILDDSEWIKDKLPENKQILTQVLALLSDDCDKFRICLQELEPSGVVNPAVFRALDLLAAGLAGNLDDERIQEAVSKMQADFTVMQERDVRKIIAGCPEGSMHATQIEYVNYLKDCVTKLCWTLHMPEVVKKHAGKINRESFEYIEIGKVRFIGKDIAKYPGILDADPAASLIRHATWLFCKVGKLRRHDFYDVPTEKPLTGFASPSFDGDYLCSVRLQEIRCWRTAYILIPPIDSGSILGR